MAQYYDLSQTGPEVQERLDEVPITRADLNQEIADRGAADTTLQQNINAEAQARETDDAALQYNIDAEETRATAAEQTNADAIAAEVTRAQGAEQTLQGNIDAEELRAKAAEDVLNADIESVEARIPTSASAQNKLVDMNTMNSSIATSMATFRGTYNIVADLHLPVNATHNQIETALDANVTNADINDYLYLQIPQSAADPSNIIIYERYKYSGAHWSFEFALNNSSFTSDQWEAINSTITSDLVGKLKALPNAQELEALFGTKQDVITDLATIRSNAESAYHKPVYGIPESDLDAETREKINSITPVTQLKTLNEIPIIGSGNIEVVQADFEDLANDKGTLKLADKAYVPNDFSGMGRVYLRKNMINASLHFAEIISDLPSTETNVLFGSCDEIVYETTNNRFLAVKHTSEGKKYYPNYQFTDSEVYSEPDDKHIYVCDANAKLYTYNDGALEETTTLMDKNVLTQDMINKPNTIYIIQYDYDIVNKEDTTTTNNLTIGGEYYSYKPITIEDNQTYRALNDCVFIDYRHNSLIGSVLVTGENESQDFAIAKKSSAASGVPVSYYNPDGAINVPTNCVLQFDGGSINNGAVIFNGTLLSGDYRFNGIISMTGSIINNEIDTSNINFIDNYLELYYIAKLKVPSIRFKKNFTYIIPATPTISDTQTVLIRDDLSSVNLDFNGSIIEDMRENGAFYDTEIPCIRFNVKNLTYRAVVPYSDLVSDNGGIDCFRAYPYGFSDSSIQNSTFIDVSAPFVSENIYATFSSKNLNLDYICVGYNNSVGSFRYLCVLWGCTSINANISAYNLRTHRIIFSEGNRDANYIINLKDVEITTAGLWLQEHWTKKSVNENTYTFYHNTNINADINCKGNIKGIISGVGHYTKNDFTEEPFALRRSDMSVSANINIFMDGVTFYQNTRLIQTIFNTLNYDEIDNPLSIKYLFDLNLNAKITNDNTPAGQTQPLISINTDANGEFGGLCVNGSINFASDSSLVKYFYIRNLNDKSHIRIKDCGNIGSIFLITNTYANFKPTFELIGWNKDTTKLRPVISSDADVVNVGRYIYNDSYGSMEGTSGDKMYSKEVINVDTITNPSNTVFSDSIHKSFALLANSITETFDPTKMAYNSDYYTLLQAYGNSRTLTITSDLPQIPESITFEQNEMIMLHYGKRNGTPFLFYQKN